MPNFSNGWLTAFKHRHNLCQWVRHGETDVVDCKQLELDLATIQEEELQAYNNNNIYNMDKTAFYWKTSLDCMIATEQMAGKKAIKACFTANLCYNASGSDEVLIWFIDTAAKPRYFFQTGVNIRNLNMHWEHNQKDWMTAAIFVKYLHWFNNYVAGCKVVLLVDGC